VAVDIEGIPVSEFYPYLRAAEKIEGRRPGKKVSRRTLERWRHDGVVRNGVRVRLRVVRLLGTDYYTCDRWLQAFVAVLNETTEPTGMGGPTPRTPGQRVQASRNARRRLDERWAAKRRGPR
jgi:hypothetical protein